MNLSPNFSLDEFVESDDAARLGIANAPGGGEVEALRLLCVLILEPLRDRLGVPLTITSGYRSPKLNAAIGGAMKSAHMSGRAADVKAKGFSPGQIAEAVIALRLPFDQIIIEFDRWLHIGMAESGTMPRREFLKAVKRDGKTVYLDA